MAQENQDPDLTHFQKIPWCAEVLSSSNTVITPTYSRRYKPSGEDALFAETFKTDDTISACISFYRRPASSTSRVEELHTLLSLGYRLNSHPGRAHGGVLATIIDEVMGNLLGVNKRLRLIATRGETVTAYLNVSYVKPVPTSSTILVTARLKEVVGRKHFVEASIKDGDGATLLRGEALFIGSEKSNLKEKL